jgi:two-component system, NarL family, invasion response regulator UvrY
VSLFEGFAQVREATDTDGEPKELRRDFVHDSSSEAATVQLLCECGALGCSETVPLTLAAVEALRRTHRAVLAPGHRLTRASENLRSAAESREDARALRAESAQLRRRARLERPGRVLVVDDSDTFRSTAAAIVGAASEVDVVGAASSGEEAIRLLLHLRPDLVLLDVRMPGLGGVETARLIYEQCPKTAIVFMSGERELLEDAAESVEAAAFVEKRDLRPETLDVLWLDHLTRD